MIAGENFERATYSRRDVHVLPREARTGEPERARNPVRGRRQRGARAALIGWHLPDCTIVRTAYPCWDDAAYRAPGHSISLPVWLLGHSRLYSAAENRWLDGKAADVREYSRAFLSSAQNYRLQHIGEIFADQHNALLQTLESGRSELVFAHLGLSARTFPAPRPGRKAGHVSGIRRQPACVRPAAGGRYSGFSSAAATRIGWALAVTSDHWFRGRDWLDAGDRCQRPPPGGRFLTC